MQKLGFFFGKASTGKSKTRKTKPGRQNPEDKTRKTLFILGGCALFSCCCSQS